jgi:hypothetical protein
MRLVPGYLAKLTPEARAAVEPHATKLPDGSWVVDARSEAFRAVAVAHLGWPADVRIAGRDNRTDQQRKAAVARAIATEGDDKPKPGLMPPPADIPGDFDVQAERVRLRRGCCDRPR